VITGVDPDGPAAERGQLPGGVLATLLGLGQARGRLVGRGAQLEQALRPGPAALGPVRAEHITGAGHGLKGLILPNGMVSRGQIIGHDHVAQELRRGLSQLGRGPD